MTKRIRVFIEDEELSQNFESNDDLVALDDLTITWGRSALYALPDATILHMSLIDRTGEFVTDPLLIGKDITVFIEDTNRCVFRGAITAVPAYREQYKDEKYWFVELTAADPIALLSSSILQGDSKTSEPYGVGSWEAATPQARLEHIKQAGATRIVNNIEPIEPIESAQPIEAHLAAKDINQRAMRIIEECYATRPLHYPTYDADADALRHVGFIIDSDIELLMNEPEELMYIDRPTAARVNGKNVGISESSVENTIQEAIDVLQIIANTEFINEQGDLATRESSTQKRTETISKRTNRTFQYHTETNSYTHDQINAAEKQKYNRFPDWIASEALKIINYQNGKVRLPRLLFDAKRLPLDTKTEDYIYRSHVQKSSIIFYNTIYEDLENVPNEFQIVGGVLRYDSSWSHEVFCVPCNPNLKPNVTIDEMVTNPKPDLDWFEQEITLKELGTITKGLD